MTLKIPPNCEIALWGEIPVQNSVETTKLGLYYSFAATGDHGVSRWGEADHCGDSVLGTAGQGVSLSLPRGAGVFPCRFPTVLSTA